MHPVFMRTTFLIVLLVFTALLTGCVSPDYDIIVRGGTIYDGSGEDPHVADLAILGDSIAAIGQLTGATARHEIDASGMAVSPGFINMLSWAGNALLRDGRGKSDIRQGVTLEVFGEGSSGGPLSEEMKHDAIDDMSEIESGVGSGIPWTTLGEYLEHMVEKGVSPNVASFVGATTIRIHELGYEDRAPTDQELKRMKALVRQAMEEGALGVGSSLIYAPAFFAETDELVALVKVAAEYDGMYISHMRDEGNRFLEAMDELLFIARESETRAEIYHLKAKGKDNWDKIPATLAKVDSAREQGLEITANMYTYAASSTGLNATMPPWVQEGGTAAWIERMKDPAIREQVALEMRTPTDEWTNNLLLAGSPEKVLLVGFREDSLKYMTGKTLADVASMRGTTPEETAIDLVIHDGSRVQAIYFVMSEHNMRKKIEKPWVSFGSDAGAIAAEGNALKSSTHPRAYGNFARLLGKYVRDEQVISLQEAVRRLTSLPAENLKLWRRGFLRPGFFADIVVFDANTISDHATFENPHQYATGVRDVVINGVPVLKSGDHTGATPGRVVRGPGWTGWKKAN